MTASTSSSEKVLLEYDGPVAIISNNNPDKRNAFDDQMDVRLFEILAELSAHDDVRAVIWRGNGDSFSTGRDVSAIGATVDVSHHELMRRGHRGIQKLFEIDAPIIAALQGWSIGGSFQRALLCDIRVAAEGARFMLPELTHGVIPDTGGVGVLYEMCGHGVVSDLVLTGRAMSASEALAHGVVSAWWHPTSSMRRPRDRRLHRRQATGHGQHGPAHHSQSLRAPNPFVHVPRADRPDLHQRFERLRRAPAGAVRRSHAALHGELSVTNLQGLAEPPEEGASALPAGTYEGQTVLVTGGGTGLGHAIAVEFARLGANLVVASRKAEHLDAARAAIEAVPGPIEVVTCDIRDPEQIATAFDQATAAFGLPDVLINNAAANFPVPAEDMSPNAWRTVVDITLNGTFFMAGEFARRHLSVGTPGSIVNVGASYAWTGGPGFAHSAAAKAGVKNMVETLAVEWGPYGIAVNGLVPGMFPHEDMTADIVENMDRSSDKDVCQPALRVGRLRELGWAATFLASPYARFISGHTLVVDGANWQRRLLTNPPVVTVRDQMGAAPSKAP